MHIQIKAAHDRCLKFLLKAMKLYKNVFLESVFEQDCGSCMSMKSSAWK